MGVNQWPMVLITSRDWLERGRERWMEGEKEWGNCTQEQTQDKEMLFFHEKCAHNDVP